MNSIHILNLTTKKLLIISVKIQKNYFFNFKKLFYFQNHLP